MNYFVGVDIGGTTSTVAIASADRQVAYLSEQFATHAAIGPNASIQAIVAAIQAGVSQCGFGADQVAAVGLATPGPATLDGVLLKTPNLNPEFWDKFPIREGLENALRQQAFNVRVHYVGDGQAAALGEYALRRGELQWRRDNVPTEVQSNLNSLFMVIVGTGLGGGEIRDGKVVRGKEGRAGHAGHLLLPDYAFRYEHDRQLVVGNACATVESAVSLTGLAHQLGYRLSLPAWSDHPLNHQEGSIRDKAKRLRQLADGGDLLAQELFDDQARALGLAFLNYNYLGDFDLLVIGGGVCDLSPTVRSRYRRIVQETYFQYALDGFRNVDRFEFSACGDSASVLGALAHAYGALNR